MVATGIEAARAYAAAAQAAKSATGAAEAGDGVEFGNLLHSALSNVVGAANNADKATANAIAGRGDLVDVVTAVAAAEASLGTVIAVRDQVIQAYQEILRMPI